MRPDTNDFLVYKIRVFWGRAHGPLVNIYPTKDTKRYAQAKKIQTDIKRYKQINRYNRYIGLKRLCRLSVWHQVQTDKDIKEIWSVPEPP